MKQFNKLIKQEIYPLLKEQGFQEIGNRKSIKWQEDVILKFEIGAVGHYFSQVTGWPSSSFGVTISPVFLFLLNDKDKIKRDAKKHIAPPGRWPSEGGIGLIVGLDQGRFTVNLENEPERKRTDLWWLFPDESNVIEVVEDLKKSFKEQAVPYLKDPIKFQYSKRRSFIEPNEESLRNYYKISNTSKRSAKYYLDTTIRFAEYLGETDDEKTYRELIKNL